MKIFQPGHSVPTALNEMIQYAGFIPAEQLNGNEILIQTELKHLFHVHLEPVRAQGFGAVPFYQEQSHKVGYLEAADTDGNISIKTAVPVLFGLRYFIIGSSAKELEVPLPEVTQTGFLQASNKWRGYHESMYHVGETPTFTITPVFEGIPDVTFTRVSTGLYKLESLVGDLFFEGCVWTMGSPILTVGTGVAKMWNYFISSPTELLMQWDEGGANPADPTEMMVNIKIFRKFQY